jgi:hypothetical protein
MLIGNNQMKKQLEDNYDRIKEETAWIVVDKLNRLENDPVLEHLVKKQLYCFLIY